MKYSLPLAILALLPLVAAAQDNVHVARLEQEVRQLQRELLTLSQLVNELRARVDRSTTQLRPPAPPAPAGTPPGAPLDAAPARWIDAVRWQALRTGMSELEVIAALGPPTSMRAQEGERVLLYALEIGHSGFLSGSVTLRDRVVAAIETPRLK